MLPNGLTIFSRLIKWFLYPRELFDYHRESGRNQCEQPSRRERINHESDGRLARLDSIIASGLTCHCTEVN